MAHSPLNDVNALKNELDPKLHRNTRSLEACKQNYASSRGRHGCVTPNDAMGVWRLIGISLSVNIAYFQKME